MYVYIYISTIYIYIHTYFTVNPGYLVCENAGLPRWWRKPGGAVLGVLDRHGWCYNNGNKKGAIIHMYPIYNI